MISPPNPNPKPEISKAVARGDLTLVQKIVDAAAAISNDEKIKTINFARQWTERNPAYCSEENLTSTTEWFDVTPITTAVMRGHEGILEYLLAAGADPTLKGCPIDDIDLASNDNEPLIDIPELHMNAFDAAKKLNRKIRRCRRSQDLLIAVKPYWKRSVYSGSSAVRHKRTVFSTSVPMNMDWILDALKGVRPLKDYPLKAKDFDDDMIDSNYYKKRKREDEKQNNTKSNKDGRPLRIKELAEVVVKPRTERQRRCCSCGDLKPDHCYSRNEQKKGVEARCISCVAGCHQSQGIGS